MRSIWKKDVTPPEYPILEGERTCDVLIIGGGMAGVLCARRLQDAGFSCILLEAGRLGGGTTANTTAKISALEGGKWAQRLERLGKERTALYFAAKQQAKEDLIALCANTDCDPEAVDAYLYTSGEEGELEKELAALHTIGARVDFCGEQALPFAATGALRLAGEAQFHPLKFLYGITGGLEIFERSRVVDLSPTLAKTENGATVRATHTVVATHFPFLNKHGGYFMKQYQHRSYVLALENAPFPQGIWRDIAEDGLSFRHYGNYLLMGGGGHRTGKDGGGWALLRSLAELYFPNAKEVAHWAAEDCMTLDTMPYIGQYGKRTPELLVATGFEKWGMTGAMCAAAVIERILLEKTDERTALFSPQRKVYAPQLICNLFSSVAGLIRPTVPRCPHLGCALRWNKQEHTWDCPCHGSRFDEDGTLLDGPANGDKHGLN